MAQTEVERRPENERGRKRSADRTEEIVAAAAALIAEVGFDRFRIQDVAEHAGCGTGAIYRRWASKEDLAADAIRALPDPEAPRTDDPVADLRASILVKLGDVAADAELLPGMIAAMRAHPVIEAAVRDRYTLGPLRAAVARVVGDDHPQLEAMTELAPALVLHRSAFDGERLDIDDIADTVIAIMRQLDR